MTRHLVVATQPAAAQLIDRRVCCFIRLVPVVPVQAHDMKVASCARHVMMVAMNRE